MKIRVQCTKCGKSYRVGQEKSGKRLRCLKCQTVVQIPVMLERNVAVAPSSPTGSESQSRPIPAEKKRRRRLKRRVASPPKQVRQSSPEEDEDDEPGFFDKDTSWGLFAGALFFFWMSWELYVKLALMEQFGGSVRTHWFFAMLYRTCGKLGAVSLIVLMGSVCLWGALSKLMKEKK